MGAAWDGYGRVSRTGDRDPDSVRFHSTALQQDSVEAWLVRHGHRLGAWVEDLNLSGGKRRPKLEELIARIESGASAGLAVYNPGHLHFMSRSIWVSFFRSRTAD